MIVIPYNENMVLTVHLSLFMFMHNENSFVYFRSSKSLLWEFAQGVSFRAESEATKKEVLRQRRIITRRHKVNLIEFKYHIVASWKLGVFTFYQSCFAFAVTFTVSHYGLGVTCVSNVKTWWKSQRNKCGYSNIFKQVWFYSDI